jgi:hypothetical protein
VRPLFPLAPSVAAPRVRNRCEFPAFSGYSFSIEHLHPMPLSPRSREK